MKTLEEIKRTIRSNIASGSEKFAGLSRKDIRAFLDATKAKNRSYVRAGHVLFA